MIQSPPHGKDTVFFKLLELIKSNRGISPKEIKSLTGDRQSPYLALAKKYGLVKLFQGQKGKYEITSKGLAFLQEEAKRVNICAECGKKFVPSKRHWHQKFCSRRCCNAWLRKAKPEYLEQLYECHKKWYRKKRNEIKIQRFLYGFRNTKGVGRRGYLRSEGCCIICGELNPLSLEEEHVFGRENSDFTVTLCANCHRIRHSVNGSGGWHLLLSLSELFNIDKTWY
jgi:predicted transcriptional regulator